MMQQNWRAAPPTGEESQISDLEVWVTGDIAERVLMSVRDVYSPCSLDLELFRALSAMSPVSQTSKYKT